MNDVVSFLKTRLADVGETYKRSNIAQIKVLLGSIFLSGLAWNYEGPLNHNISPLYQAIRTFDEGIISLGAKEAIDLEPLLEAILTHWKPINIDLKTILLDERNAYYGKNSTGIAFHY